MHGSGPRVGGVREVERGTDDRGWARGEGWVRWPRLEIGVRVPVDGGVHERGKDTVVGGGCPKWQGNGFAWLLVFRDISLFILCG